MLVGQMVSQAHFPNGKGMHWSAAVESQNSNSQVLVTHPSDFLIPVCPTWVWWVWVQFFRVSWLQGSYSGWVPGRWARGPPSAGGLPTGSCPSVLLSVPVNSVLSWWRYTQGARQHFIRTCVSFSFNSGLRWIFETLFDYVLGPLLLWTLISEIQI